MTSSVIYYSTDERKNEIYLLNKTYKVAQKARFVKVPCRIIKKSFVYFQFQPKIIWKYTLQTLSSSKAHLRSRTFRVENLM